MLASQFHKQILNLAIATLVSISKILNCEQGTWENTTKFKKRKTRKTRRKANSNSLKRMSVDKKTNPPKEIRFDETKRKAYEI